MKKHPVRSVKKDDLVRRVMPLEIPETLDAAKPGVTLIRLSYAKSRVPEMVSNWAGSRGTGTAPSIWVDCHFRGGDRLDASGNLYIVQTAEPRLILRAAEEAFRAGTKTFVVWPVTAVFNRPVRDSDEPEVRPLGESALLVKHLGALAVKHKAVVICGAYIQESLLEATQPRPSRLRPLGVHVVEVVGPVVSHPETLPFGVDLTVAARLVANLRYDAMVKFLDHLSAHVADDAGRDAGRGRPKLAGQLCQMSRQLSDAAVTAGHAWGISKRYVEKGR
jgi:hypothetical protein